MHVTGSVKKVKKLKTDWKIGKSHEEMKEAITEPGKTEDRKESVWETIAIE